MNPYGVENQVSLGGLIKNKDLWQKYVAICKRNNRTVTEDLEAFIADTVKNHETGNDQFKIDQWVDNYDMKAVPAFNSKNETWKNYVENTSLQNFNEIKLKHEQLGGIFSQIKTTQKARKKNGELRAGFDQRKIAQMAQRECTKERQRLGLCEKPMKRKSTRKGQVRKTARRAFER